MNQGGAAVGTERSYGVSGPVQEQQDEQLGGGHEARKTERWHLHY